MSYADLAAAAHLSSVDYLGDVPWSEDEAAKNWYARVKSRPSFRPLLADDAAGRAAVGDLRRPRLLSDPAALKAALIEAAREHGFDTVGVARPDAVPQAKARLEQFLAEGAHGDMDWMETTAQRRGDPRALWPDVRSVIMLGVNYGPRARSARDPRTARARRDLGLCAGRRLSRDHQDAAQGAGALADRAGGRRREGVRRHRRGDGEAARRQRRPRLAGQAHQSRLARLRLVAVSRRDLHHARTAAGRRRRRPLRHLPRLPRRLPDRGVSRALSARCAALHLLSHHRAQRPDPARAAPADGQPHLRLRRLPRGVPLEQVRAGRAARRSSPRAATCARPSSPSWRGSTMRRSARCSPRPRSSAPAATASCATC